jgi:Protein of unknown function (DUF2771)
VRTRAAVLVCCAGVLAGCAGEPESAPSVRVETGARDVSVSPSQYCLDGEGQTYAVTPPIVEVSPGSPIRISVPDSLAERGWSVQVFDEGLEELIGEVDVPEGTAVFDEITSSDVVPAAFYLVVVEDSGGDCGEFSGAWPTGFIRAGGELDTPSSSPAG